MTRILAQQFPATERPSNKCLLRANDRILSPPDAAPLAGLLGAPGM